MTPDDRILAAELVIGLLPDDEARRAAARAAAEPDFAQEVEWWQDRFAALLDRYDEVPPPEYLAERVATLVALPRVEDARKARPWTLVGLGAAGGALAASVVAWLLAPAPPMPAPSPPIAVVQPQRLLVASLAWSKRAEQPAPVAIVEPGTGALRLSAVVEVPGDRVGELWRIPAGGKPIALGLLEPTRGQRLRLTGVRAPAVGDTLAISVEPAGGAPGDQPTGPVIATGVLSAV